MSARVIIVRHGNTFRPEDKPVWVGARSDLPLVEKGIAQAEELADALAEAHITPAPIIAGPLKRTRETAQIIAGRVHAEIHIDPRLCEIDYGAWEGKSSEDIIASGDAKALEAWNKHSLFPAGRGWTPGEAQIIVNTAAILAEVKEGTALIVTSNGILRFFARAAVNASDFPDHKVGTGNICVMERDEHRHWRITLWNQPPHILGT